MASPADVENTIKALLLGALYPTGTGNPASAAGGLQVALMRGWPNKEELKADLAAGRCVVSIWPRPGERPTTRYPREWETLTQHAPALTATVNADETTITLAGTPSTPLNVAAIVNGVGHVYPVQADDTLDDVAIGLATVLIDAGIGASRAGAVVTVDCHALEARVGGAATMIRELARQERQWDIIAWCSTPEQRDVLAAFLDVELKRRDFITLPDGSVARIQPVGGMPNDRAEVEGLFRFDLVFTVEYATTETSTAMQTIVGDLNIEVET